MRRWFVAPLFGFILTNSYASNSVATDEIKYLSQKIAFEYLCLKQSGNEAIKESILSDIDKLSESLRSAAKSQKNADKNILNFIAYSKDEIKELLERKDNKESQIKILDISDSLYEGIKSIDTKADSNKTEFYKLLKLYLALNLDYLDTKETKALVLDKVKRLDKSFGDSGSWHTLKSLITQNQSDIPTIIYLLSNALEKEKR